MAIDRINARGRRLSYALTLFAGIIVPTTLRIFLVADTSHLSHFWESRLGSLQGDDIFWNEYVHSVDGDTDQLMANEYRRKVLDSFTRIKANHYELSRMLIMESMDHQIDRKRYIHAIVTVVVAFMVPFLAFLCAFVFLKNPQGYDESTNKRKRRKERILQGLKECRIQLPTATIKDDTTAEDQFKQRECPICLATFVEGDVVVASKYCHCSIRNRSTGSMKNQCDQIADRGKIQVQRHRTCFHESCIFEWLSQRKTNPKKLCPCCRQPFLASKQR